MSVLLSGPHALVALELLGGTCCAGGGRDSSTGTNDVCEALEVSGEMLLRQLE
jgi:hypothetical protein